MTPLQSAASSTVPQLRGLLEVARLVRDERDPSALVDRIAAIVSDSLGFATVAISLYRPAEDDLQVTTVHGNEAARAALLGSARKLDVFEPFLSADFLRRGAYLIPHDEGDWERLPSYVPDLPVGTAPGAWHPEDALMVPMRGADGSLLGIVSVDEPESGLRPGDEELDVLVAFAQHVGVAIEAAQSAGAAARDRAALSRLLDVSASLVELDSVESVLGAVARGIHEALDFEKVAVCIATPEGRFAPAGTAGWAAGDPGLDFSLTQADLDALLVPEFELEGCYLIENEVANALVGNRSNYSSQRGGSGPHAWRRHWLLVPLVERDGSRRGFVWADDPVDSLLPSRGRLQALRTFANQATMALRAALDFETLNARNRELDALHETTLALLRRTGLDSLLSGIVASACALVGTEDGYLYLVDPETDRLRLAVGVGYFEELTPPPIARGEGLSGRVWTSRSALVVDDYASWVSRIETFRPTLHASVGVPLIAGDEVVGVLGLVHESPDRRFDADEVALLERFAQLASLALESARLYESLQREIVESDRLHEQLRQAQKMEAVGRLAGGIAHDFNNLLTAIGGYAELGLADLRAGDADAAADGIAQISRASSRAAELTAQLLAFSRKQVLDPQELDLNETVSDMASLLARMLGEDVVLSADLDTELGTVLADPGQVEQVVLNLAVNARDAMPAGGDLTIRTRNVDLPAGETPPAPGLRPGHYVLLEVEDTGVGMVQTLTERIFEPFFTTKEVGAGTGLGLATVHGIVTQSGGAVWVESTPGEGTCFSIYLPRV